jgi:hypothetical protein
MLNHSVTLIIAKSSCVSLLIDKRNCVSLLIDERHRESFEQCCSIAFLVDIPSTIDRRCTSFIIDCDLLDSIDPGYGCDVDFGLIISNYSY